MTDTATASARGRRCRRKGADFERDTVRALAEAFTGETVKRNLAQTRCGEREGADVEVGAILAVECKVGDNPPLWRALAQAEEAARPGQWPVVVAKRTREEPVVFMRRKDFLELAGAWFLETGGKRRA